MDSEQVHKQEPTSAAPVSEPGGVGGTAEVGPFLVTLNHAENRLNRFSDKGSEDHRYALTDLTLENGAQNALDASDTDYVLRDEEGAYRPLTNMEITLRTTAAAPKQ